MKEIIINDKPVLVKEYGGQRVVTLKDIDTVHGRPEGTARKRFNENKKRFVEGEDYFKITPSEFRTAIGEMNSKQQNKIILITESGYLMLVKSFHDDLAWNVQRQLVNSYFRMQNAEPDFSGLSPQLQFMIQMEKRQNQLETRQAQLEERFENGERNAYLNGLQNARTLTSLEQNYFKKLVRAKAENLFLKQERSEKWLSLRQIQTEMYHAINRVFHVKAVSELRQSDLGKAADFVRNFELTDIVR